MLSEHVFDQPWTSENAGGRMGVRVRSALRGGGFEATNIPQNDELFVHRIRKEPQHPRQQQFNAAQIVLKLFKGPLFGNSGRISSHLDTILPWLALGGRTRQVHDLAACGRR